VPYEVPSATAGSGRAMRAMSSKDIDYYLGASGVALTISIVDRRL
jgi:hypothetical protein